MLTLSKKTDYALIALADLAANPRQVASARHIAERYGLPSAMLMNLLKSLHQAGLVRSTRGPKGGYQLAMDPHQVSLYELVQVVDGQVQLTDCAEQTDQCARPGCRIRDACPVQAPLHALHHKLVQFLKDVKLSDLILPGHRIDVPLERVASGR